MNAYHTLSGDDVKELIRCNDPVLISYLTAVLEEEGIATFLLDEHTAILEGSIGAIQRRIMVTDEDFPRAEQILDEIGEGETPA